MGLGDATRIEEVTVRWPFRGAEPQRFVGFAAGSAYRLVEGTAEPAQLGREVLVLPDSVPGAAHMHHDPASPGDGMAPMGGP